MEIELKDKIIKMFEKQFPIISKIEKGSILFSHIDNLWINRDNVRSINFTLYQKHNVNIQEPLLFLGFECDCAGPYFCKFLYKNEIILIKSVVIESRLKLHYMKIAK